MSKVGDLSVKLAQTKVDPYLAKRGKKIAAVAGYIRISKGDRVLTSDGKQGTVTSTPRAGLLVKVPGEARKRLLQPEEVTPVESPDKVSVEEKGTDPRYVTIRAKRPGFKTTGTPSPILPSEQSGVIWLKEYPDEPNDFVVSNIEVAEELKGKGVATAMARKFHETYPKGTLVHGAASLSPEGEKWATTMVKRYPSWNRFWESAT